MGTTIFNGSIDATGNLSLTMQNVTFHSTVQTGSEGTVSIANAGTLLLNNGADFTLGALFPRLVLVESSLQDRSLHPMEAISLLILH